MNAEISQLDELADAIATARTFSDLATVRVRLQHTIGILERRVLENAVIEREKSLIHFYLPNAPDERRPE